MKQVTIIFSILVAFWSVGQDGLYQYAPSTITENLKDSVKSINTKSYTGIEKNGRHEILKSGWKYSWRNDSKAYYDSSGHLVKELLYDEHGKELRIEYFNYINEQLIESKKLYHHRFYKYDSLGRIEVETYKSLQPSIITTGNEKPIDRSSFINVSYFYNPINELILKIEIDSANRSIKLDSIYYDISSNPIRIKTYYRDIIEFQLMEYDTHGNLTLLSCGDNYDGLMERTKFQYSNGVVSLEDWELYSNNEFDGRVIYTYDKGNNIKIVESESDGTVSSFEESTYMYDAKGNWIRKTTIDDGKIYIITRDIEYY